jgi:hypothetical protein
MNEIPKVVFSNSLTSAGWGETTIATGDLAEAVTRLKQERSDARACPRSGAGDLGAARAASGAPCELSARHRTRLAEDADADRPAAARRASSPRSCRVYANNERDCCSPRRRSGRRRSQPWGCWCPTCDPPRVGLGCRCRAVSRAPPRDAGTAVRSASCWRTSSRDRGERAHSRGFAGRCRRAASPGTGCRPGRRRCAWKASTPAGSSNCRTGSVRSSGSSSFRAR